MNCDKCQIRRFESNSIWNVIFVLGQFPLLLLGVFYHWSFLVGWLSYGIAGILSILSYDKMFFKKCRKKYQRGEKK